MSILSDVDRIMQLVEKFGEMCEWHGARPGDDVDGQKDQARQVLEVELRLRFAEELATLSVIEPHLASIERPEVAGCLKIIRSRLEKIAPTAPVEYPLERLGGVVGLERPDGSMALASWTDKAVSVFAIFSCDPYSQPMARLRGHITQAFDVNCPKPQGSIRCICSLNAAMSHANADQ